MGYTRSPSFQTPEAWLQRLEGYTGILYALAKYHKVISIEQIDFAGEYNREGVSYHFLNLPDQSRLFPRRLHQQVKKLAPDIVIVHSLHFPLQLIQLRWLLGKDVKIFIQHHAEKSGTGLKKYAQRMADHSINGYFFAAAAMADEWLLKKIIRSQKKIFEIMEASSAFKEKPAGLSRTVTGIHGDPVFLWVGRLDSNKDPLLVVRSFMRFQAHHPGATLYLIYTGVELLPDLTALCKQLDRGADVIHLVPGQKHAAMNDWFASADFIISSSHYEGSGVAICEAMSCGCIPVLTDIPSFRMMTADGSCGILYAAGDETALEEALEKCMHTDRQVFRKRVLRRFSRKLSFDGIAADILQAIGTA